MGRNLAKIDIAGELFTIKSKTVDEPRYNTTAWNTLKLLGDCYDNPSPAKVSIHHHWLQWMYHVNNFGFEDMDVTILEFGIRSYNTFSFNYGGIIIIDGVRYVIDITASHNFLWRIA